MSDWLFDGANKIAQEPLGATDVIWDLDRDIYSAWKRWAAAGGAGALNAFIVEGGTPIGSTGISTGSSFVLVNGWKMRLAEYDHHSTVIGNLFSDDGVVSVPALSGSSTLFVQGAVAAQGINTGESFGLTQQNLIDLAEKVWRYQRAS